MSDPITFTTASPRYQLPLLFAGQAQKEFFVNQAHSIADSLLHPTIEGTASSPPANPEDGESWLVAANATDEWENREDTLACRQAGVWIFITPRDGLRLFDRSIGQFAYFSSGAWQWPFAPSAPDGGTTIDAEARESITEMIATLRNAGIFPAD